MVHINGQIAPISLLGVKAIESRLIERFESVVTEIRSCFAWGQAGTPTTYGDGNV